MNKFLALPIPWIFGLIAPLLLCPYQATATQTITIDATHVVGELPHFWTTLGLDHSGLLLEPRDGWGEKLQGQLVKAIDEIGLSGIRQHGILHDDVGIYREIAGKPHYDFHRADLILDTYRRLGLTPVIEFGGMPHDLASNPRATAFKWQQGVSPPKSWTRWEELIFRFVQHYSERYGKDEVAAWYFEVWNEPDMRKFWSGTQQDYFKLYDHTVAGAKRANPAIRIGGPSPSGPHQITDNTKLGERFIDHVFANASHSQASDSRLDFFSLHTWNFLDANINGYFQAVDFLAARRLDLPILVTEAGPTWQFNLDPQPHDTVHGAAFIVETLANLIQRTQQHNSRLPTLWVWWVLSDLFEEGTYREADPFIGCMGLLTREGIEKPAYHVFQLLHRMGRSLLEVKSDQQGAFHAFATRKSSDAFQLILSHGKNPGRGPSDGRFYEDSNQDETVNLEIRGLDQAHSHLVKIYRIDREHGDAFTTWVRMGRPSLAQLTADAWKQLRNSMQLPAPEILRLESGRGSLALELPSPAVAMLEITQEP